MVDEIKPWAQLDGEPAEAYARFLLYRNLGPGRSLDAAYTLHRGDAAAAKGSKGIKRYRAPGQWREDSVSHRWVERATAWDIEQLLVNGQQTVVNYMAALQLYSQRLVEALNNDRTQPRNWGEATEGLGFLGRLVSPDAAEQLYQGRAGAPEPAGAELDDDDEPDD